MTSRPGYWEYPAALDGSSYGEVVVPIDDFLLAGAFAALFEQLDGIFPFGFQRNASSDSLVAVDSFCGLAAARDGS